MRRSRFLVLLALLAWLAPVVALACMPITSNGMEAMPPVVDVIGELPGGG